MAETRYICKHSDGMGHCEISDDWCCSGPCTMEEDIEYTPVVRCKDCRHMEKSQYGRYCQIWGMYNGHGDDGFCSYGERKEGAE